MHTITLVSYSVLTVTSRLETVGKEKLEKKKRGCVCALSPSATRRVRWKTIREETHQAVRNRSRKETAVIKEGFN